MESDDLVIQLIDLAKDGERAAFDRLVDLHRPRIEALIRARLGPHVACRIESDDVLQETLLRAYESLRGFVWTGDDAFMRWLGTIVENVIRGAARRAARRDAATPAQPRRCGDLTQSRALRRDERFDRFQAAFDALDPDARTVVHMARIQGLPIRDIAARIGRTPNATSILLYRALMKLKDLFGDTESLHLPFRMLEDTDAAE